MNEDVLLEEVLALAEQDGYEPAYDFLLAQRGAWKDGEHPQIYYFLACLAAGAGRAPAALEWLAEAVEQKEYWYRPEVLDDGDLKPLFGDARFETLRKISEGRYEEARRAGRMRFSWRGRAAGTLVLAVHGNGQNAGIARRDWAPLERAGAQVETVQSSVVDCTGRFRWEYDGENYRQTADAARIVQDAGYERQVWAGFSAGCDMLLRTLLYTGLSCNTLALQSPWTPLLEKDCAAVCRALAKKRRGASFLRYAGQRLHRNGADAVRCAAQRGRARAPDAADGPAPPVPAADGAGISAAGNAPIGRRRTSYG